MDRTSIAGGEGKDRRFEGRPKTHDLAGVDHAVMALTVAAAFRGEADKLTCGCVPGLGLCQDKADLADRIRKAKRRAAVRGDRGPLEEAMAEARAHWAAGSDRERGEA